MKEDVSASFQELKSSSLKIRRLRRTTMNLSNLENVTANGVSPTAPRIRNFRHHRGRMEFGRMRGKRTIRINPSKSVKDVVVVPSVPRFTKIARSSLEIEPSPSSPTSPSIFPPEEEEKKRDRKRTPLSPIFRMWQRSLHDPIVKLKFRRDNPLNYRCVS